MIHFRKCVLLNMFICLVNSLDNCNLRKKKEKKNPYIFNKKKMNRQNRNNNLFYSRQNGRRQNSYRRNASYPLSQTVKMVDFKSIYYSLLTILVRGPKDRNRSRFLLVLAVIKSFYEFCDHGLYCFLK